MRKSQEITLTAKRIDKSLFVTIFPIGMFFFIMFTVNQLYRVSILGMYIFILITSLIMMTHLGYWYYKLKKIQKEDENGQGMTIKSGKI